jgi:hypothetical protein
LIPVITVNAKGIITSATTATPTSGVTSLAGTTNQVSVSGASGAVTLSTPQNLHTSASFQVGSLGIGTAASGTTGELRATNNITAYYSDMRLKSKVCNIENALDKIDQLTGFLYVENDVARSFGFKSTGTQVALSAQDVQRVQPEAVKPAPFDISADGGSISGEHYLTVQYERLVPLIVQAIKELRVEVELIKTQQSING